MRILVVEDTADVGEAIVSCLKRLGHAVDWARNGIDGDELLSTGAFDLAVLDLMLPGMDGAAILKALRERQGDTPVLVLTARSTISDRVDVLDLGADDYLVKPFDFRELEARVRALLRRRSGDRTNMLRCGGIELDRAARSVRVNDEVVSLTRREIALLEILMAQRGSVFSKSHLLDNLFGYGSDPTENAVEVLVGRVRRKVLAAAANITTVRGLGYRIDPT